MSGTGTYEPMDERWDDFWGALYELAFVVGEYQHGRTDPLRMRNLVIEVERRALELGANLGTIVHPEQAGAPLEPWSRLIERAKRFR